MRNFIIKRFFLSFLVLFGVSIISFGILYFTPGDPVQLLLPEGSSQQTINAMREKLGLNKPIQVQYLVYMRGVIKGDLGTSIYFKKPNLSLIIERIPATFLLTSAAVFTAILVSLPLGVIAGVKQGTFADFFAMFFALSGQSMCPVWLGFLLIFTFSVKLRILPSFGYGDIKALIMPTITLGLPVAALLTRLTRAGTIDILNEDYILATRAKGIREKKIIMRYALKNILIPVITVAGLQFATLIAGAMVTESIFNWPGLGKLSILAIYGRDFPLIRAIILVVSSFFVSINLLVDILYTLLDPRLKFS